MFCFQPIFESINAQTEKITVGYFDKVFYRRHVTKHCLKASQTFLSDVKFKCLSSPVKQISSKHCLTSWEWQDFYNKPPPTTNQALQTPLSRIISPHPYSFLIKTTGRIKRQSTKIAQVTNSILSVCFDNRNSH